MPTEQYNDRLARAMVVRRHQLGWSQEQAAAAVSAVAAAERGHFSRDTWRSLEAGIVKTRNWQTVRFVAKACGWDENWHQDILEGRDPVEVTLPAAGLSDQALLDLVERLERIVEELRADNAVLDGRLAELERRLSDDGRARTRQGRQRRPAKT
jgi:hypothetical protein